jgi:hypothetical protein
LASTGLAARLGSGDPVVALGNVFHPDVWRFLLLTSGNSSTKL